MTEPTLEAVLNGTADNADAPSAPPAAGRTRTAVATGGSSIIMQVGDSIEAYFNGTSDVAGKFGVSKLFKFTLIAPADVTVVSKDQDTGVKSEERKSLDAGSVVTMFLKGNGPWAMGNVVEGTDIELRRLEDGVLPKGHKFAGTAVATFEVLS